MASDFFLRKCLTRTWQWRSFHEFSSAAGNAQKIFLFFYLFTLMMAYVKFPDLLALSEGLPPVEPLWPLRGVLALGMDYADLGYVLGLTFQAVALLACLRMHWLCPRLLVFLCILLLNAWENSYNAVFHSLYYWTYISFCLVFLPSVPLSEAAPRLVKMRYINVFWFAQLSILLTYTLSGLWKVMNGLIEYQAGQTSFLEPEGLSALLAGKALEIEKPGFLAHFFIETPMVAWPFHLGLIAIECVALLIFFRPALYRFFGATIILFHIGTGLLMNIHFSMHILFNGLLFLMAPLAESPNSLKKMVMSLPLLSWLFPASKVTRSARELWVIYDGECPYCRHYVRLVKLRESVGCVHLVNAREADHEAVREVRARGYDLHGGMVVKMNNHYYHGDEALHLLALLTDHKTVFNFLSGALFSRRWVARTLYPLFRLCRKITLRIKGIPPL